MQIDFYILEQSNEQQSLLFACQLIEKMYEKHKIYLHFNSYEAANRMDHLLWTFRDDSFIPHQLYHPNTTFPPPVQLGYEQAPPHHEVIINFSQQSPDFFAHFNHLIEIVFAEPSMQQSARERYRHYRSQGHDIKTYKL